MEDAVEAASQASTARLGRNGRKTPEPLCRRYPAPGQWEDPTTPGSRGDHVRFYVVLALFWGSLYLFVPLMAPFAQLRGASLQTVGLLVSAYGLSQLILRIPLGVWSDRLGARRPFITYGFLAGVAGALGMALVDSPGAMIFFRGLTGVCASMWVMLLVVYASLFEPGQTGRAMGMAQAATTVIQLTSTLVGGLVAQRWGWEAPFVAAAGLGAAGMMLSAALGERRTQASPPELRELVLVGRERLLIQVSLLAALLQSINYLTLYGFTPVYAAGLGASMTQLGLLSFAGGVPMAAGSFLGGSWLMPRYGARNLVGLAFVLSAAGVVLIPLASQVWTLMLLQMAVGLGVGVALPTLLALSIQTVRPERRATAMGVFQSVLSLGLFGGPVLGGILGQAFGLPSVFLAAGGLAVGGSVVAARYLPATLPGAPARQSAPWAAGAAGRSPDHL